MFTDWYGEQSCTAGRAAFITGQSPIRTGLTKVGLPGADLGLQPQDPTVAEFLKPLGYATGQFGKNHLGDKDEFLPTNHGFDEFFGNLYHLNAEEEPENPDYPKDPEFRKRFGPRGVIKASADGRIEDTGPLTKQAHGDHRRGDLGAAPRLHRPASTKPDKPWFCYFNSDPHARQHASEAGVGRQDRQGRLSRRHGRARRPCRPAPEEARRSRRRRQHHRGLHHRQRRRSDDLAGWRHHAVPRRKGDQLGRRLSRAE